MNTDIVRTLTVQATKPIASDLPAQKRTTDVAPVPPQVSTKTTNHSIVSAGTSIQEAAAHAAAQIESYLKSTGRSVQFSIDSASGRTVVSVRNASTGDVIRQMPSEEALRLAEALGSQPNALIDAFA